LPGSTIIKPPLDGDGSAGPRVLSTPSTMRNPR
jgi:hypothetical protein